MPDEKKIPADASDITTKDTGFSVHSSPDYLLEIAKICLEAKCFQDLALQCLNEYISILTYYKEFPGQSAEKILAQNQKPQIDLVNTRKLVIIMMARCLTAIGSLNKSKVYL